MAAATYTRSYLVGLIGAGIGTSLSPALHEHEAGCLGLDYAYRVLDIDELGVEPREIGALLERAREQGFDGLNVTHPCKQLVLEHLDALTEEAAALGAVNTVVLRDGRALGDNTDGTGFAESFRRGLPGAQLDRALLIGAGGAGAAVAHALLGLGCVTLEVLDTDRERAEGLVEALRARFGPERARVAEPLRDPRAGSGALAGFDGVVNATPTGMVGHGGTPVPKQLLRPDLWVADVVYRPLETELLRDARAAGCRTLDGGGMVVLQAAGSFERFTGRTADRDRMLRHFATLR
jgi:quinate/shikimate dehydrogenase (NAD+)